MFLIHIVDKVDIAEMLIKKFGLKVNAQNNEDNTPLHIAAVRGKTEQQNYKKSK